jgi:hypothetical protein
MNISIDKYITKEYILNMKRIIVNTVNPKMLALTPHKNQLNRLKTT